MPPDKRSDSPNIRLAQLAERQHGAVATRQLLALGVSRTTIAEWKAEGRLHSRHRGVYAVGHERLSDEGRLWAAKLAAPTAPFDERTSAWAWRVLAAHPDPLRLVSNTDRRDTDKLRFRITSLSVPSVNLRDLLATDLATTLGQLPPGLRRKATANAAYAGLLPRTRDTESGLEDLYLSITRAANLEEPTAQYRIGARRTDFVYEERRLIIEIDDARGHDNAHAFQEDRRRDAEHLVDGWRTVRFTEHQLLNDPAYVVGIMTALLTR